MQDQNIRPKMLLVLITIVLVSGIFLGGITVVGASFEEDFSRANDWDSYRGDVGNKNARLIQNVTAVLHRENLEILKEIESLKAEISNLKQMIEGF